MVGFGIILLSALINSAPAATTRDLVAAEVQNYVLRPSYEPYVDPDAYSSWAYYRQVCHQTLADLPQEVRAPLAAVSEKLQASLFGGSLFKFKLCFIEGLATDLQERTIYIEGAFISRLVSSVPPEKLESVLAVLIGHELGHYIYEEILFSTDPSQSALGHHASWFDVSLVRSATNPQEQFLIHGEIDAIGFNIAERAGYDVEVARHALNEVEAILGGQVIPGKVIRQSVIDAYLAP